MRRFVLIAFLCVAPLLAVGAFAQPVLPPLTAVDTPGGTFAASPVCAGPNAKWNAADFFAGTNPDGGRVLAARCLMPDGGFAWWIRERPAGEDINAPIAWLTDVAPRQTPVPLLYSVVPGTSGDKTRPAYALVRGTGGFTLGKANGQRAAGGVACACDMAIVKVGSTTYCPFAPAPSIASVAVCKVVTTAAALKDAMPTAKALDMARDPMMAH